MSAALVVETEETQTSRPAGRRFGRLFDRLADRALVAVAAINLLFFAVFVATLLSAATAFSEEPEKIEPLPGCKGTDLVEKLRRSDPDRLAAAVAEGNKVENGRSIFWRIEKPGLTPSWLFGTMHSADPRVTTLPEVAEAAFNKADTVIIESTEALEKEKMAAAMLQLKNLTFLADGATLDALVPAESVKGLRAAVEARKMPWVLARHMQPWMIAAAIAVPVCEVEAKNSGTPVLDHLLGQRARDEGKQLVGLETIEEQFRAVSSIPPEFHLNALNETLKLGPLTDSMMETTKALYLEGNTGLLLPLIRAYAPETYTGKGYADFQRQLIANRNRTMQDRALEYLEKGNAFVAVGAMHLPGETGLVALLRQHGYELKPITP